MELWEGAVLAVGGLWLVGYMSRKNAGHPVNAANSGITNASNLTNTGVAASSGAPSLVAGEPVAAPVRMQPIGTPIQRIGTLSTPNRPGVPVRPIAQHL